MPALMALMTIIKMQARGRGIHIQSDFKKMSYFTVFPSRFLVFFRQSEQMVETIAKVTKLV